jgi:hypothetical protein
MIYIIVVGTAVAYAPSASWVSRPVASRTCVHSMNEAVVGTMETPASKIRQQVKSAWAGKTDTMASDKNVVVETRDSVPTALVKDPTGRPEWMLGGAYGTTYGTGPYRQTVSSTGIITPTGIIAPAPAAMASELPAPTGTTVTPASRIIKQAQNAWAGKDVLASDKNIVFESLNAVPTALAPKSALGRPEWMIRDGAYGTAPAASPAPTMVAPPAATPAAPAQVPTSAMLQGWQFVQRPAAVASVAIPTPTPPPVFPSLMGSSAEAVLVTALEESQKQVAQLRYELRVAVGRTSALDAALMDLKQSSSEAAVRAEAAAAAAAAAIGGSGVYAQTVQTAYTTDAMAYTIGGEAPPATAVEAAAVEVAPSATAIPRSVPRKQRDPSAMTPAKMIMKASMQAWKEKASELQSNARDPALDGKIAHTRPGWMRTCGAY